MHDTFEKYNRNIYVQSVWEATEEVSFKLGRAVWKIKTVTSAAAFLYQLSQPLEIYQLKVINLKQSIIYFVKHWHSLFNIKN